MLERLTAPITRPRPAAGTGAPPPRIREVLAGELVPALILGLAVTGWVVWGFGALWPDIAHISTFDFWFESDVYSIFQEMTNRWSSSHVRNTRHPLFSLIAYPPTYALSAIFGLGDGTAVEIGVWAGAVLWVLSFYAVLRFARLTRPDAVVFSLLAVTSATALFWLPVPESFTLGAITINMALIGIAVAAYRPIRFWQAVLIATATLAVTATNWMAGLLFLVLVAPPKRAVLAGIASLLVVIALSLLQKGLFPASGLLIDSSAEAGYLFHPLAGSIADKMGVFFVHSFYMPEPAVGFQNYLTIQRVPVFARGAGIVSVGVTVLWLALLVVGARAALYRENGTLLKALLLMVLGGLGLAVLFGQETFLYSMHWGPLLVGVAAAATLTKARPFALAAAIVLVPVAMVNNTVQFERAAIDLRQRYGNMRAFVASVGTVTDSSTLLVQGLQPALAEGRHLESAPEFGEPSRLARLPAFDSLEVHRLGWTLPYEFWSADRLRVLRNRGARYFISSYPYGLARRPDVLEGLTLVAGGRAWAIYELPPAPARASPPTADGPEVVGPE